MKMLKPIALSQFNISELEIAAEKILKLYNCYVMNDSLLEDIIIRIKIALKALQSMQSKVETNEITKQINEANAQRDATFLGLRHHCKAWTYHPDKKIHEQAEQICEIIRNLGWSMFNYNYNEQSAHLNELLHELEKKEYKKAIVSIGALFWIKKLKTLQSEFESISGQKLDIKTISPDLAKYKNDIYKSLSAFFSLVDMKFTNEKDKYQAFVSRLNQLITEVTNHYQSRKNQLHSDPDSFSGVSGIGYHHNEKAS